MGYTASANAATVQEQWFIVDAAGQTLGRLATEIAYTLRGKHLPTYTPHVNPQAHVVVINAAGVQLTGKKWTDKKYHRHTGYIGGLKTVTAQELRDKKPEELIRHAVHGMLPKNRLGACLMTNLRIYAGSEGEERHKAQKPQPLPKRTAEAAA